MLRNGKNFVSALNGCNGNALVAYSNYLEMGSPYVSIATFFNWIELKVENLYSTFGYNDGGWLYNEISIQRLLATSDKSKLAKLFSKVVYDPNEDADPFEEKWNSFINNERFDVGDLVGNQKFRDRFFTLKNDRCECCGKLVRKEVTINGNTVTVNNGEVHHIIGRKDSGSSDSLENLALFCSNCHTTYHKLFSYDFGGKAFANNVKVMRDII